MKYDEQRPVVEDIPGAPTPEYIRQQALHALRQGDFDFALKAVQRGEMDLARVLEDFKIYQAELEIQNEELRDSQARTETAVRQFMALFAYLPLPALVVDTLGVVKECNEQAVQRFGLDRRRLRSHYFPRFLQSHEHKRLHDLLAQTQDSGNGMMAEVELRMAQGDSFIGDIHAALLPESAKNPPHFAILVVDQTLQMAQRLALAASEQHFMAYFTASPVGMAALDSEGRWIEVNDRLCELLGYSAQELRLTTWAALTHPEDIAAETRLWNQVHAGLSEGYTLDKRFIRANRATLDSHTAVRAVCEAGRVAYCVVLIEDIGPRRHAERALAASESELRYQSVQLRLRVRELGAIYAISQLSQDKLDTESFLNRALELIPSGLRHPEQAWVSIRLGDCYREAPSGLVPTHPLRVDIRVDGRTVGEIQAGYALPEQGLDIGPLSQEEQQFIASVAELAGLFKARVRHEREQALVVSRNSALLALTTQAPTLGEMNLLQVALEQAERLTGSKIGYVHLVNVDQDTVEFGTWSRQTLEVCRAMHESHYPLLRAGVWADSFRLRQPVIHNDYAAVSNQRGLPEGHAKLIRHLGVPVIEGGQVTLLMGVGNKAEPYDDGDRALLEMIANNTWALLQRNRAHAQLNLDAEVFRFSREGVLITDPGTVILSVNPAFTRITGFEPAEALGQTPRIMKSGRHEGGFYAEMWQSIRQQGYWQGEVWNRRRDGELYPQWLSISEVKDSHGEAIRYIGLLMDISDYKHAQARIEFLANHDSLTQLPNRTLLRDRARHAFALAQRQGTQVALMFLDIDHFKNINDSLGHPVGDDLLVAFAGRLKACLRDSDTISRLGGDEFVLLLGDIHHPEHIVDIARKILEVMAQPFAIGGGLTISCSIGATVYPDDGEDFDTLLKKADTAMYQAKNRGRNTYQFFTEEMNQRVVQRLRLESDMRRGLERDEFYLEYQPQFDLGSGRLVGVEALARWRHPQLGVVSPAVFIPVAEDSGLIVELGQALLRQACLQGRAWADFGFPLRIAVNVSSVQFSRHNLVDMVRDTLAATGLAHDCLELELTESVLMSATEHNLRVVAALSAMGIRFAIDDFGTGYSSLSYLKRFAVHKLKIDQSFVRDVPGDQDDEVIVGAIVTMARSLGIQSIAEGVETQAQSEFLQRLGCDQAQGYWYSRPLAAEAVRELLVTR